MAFFRMLAAYQIFRAISGVSVLPFPWSAAFRILLLATGILVLAGKRCGFLLLAAVFALSSISFTTSAGNSIFLWPPVTLVFSSGFKFILFEYSSVISTSNTHFVVDAFYLVGSVVTIAYVCSKDRVFKKRMADEDNDFFADSW
jgi:hypothetical protein